jgi:hypothetical protein
MFAIYRDLVFVSLMLSSCVGCGAQQRALAGGTVGAIGGLTVCTGIAVSAVCVTEDDDPNTAPCNEDEVRRHIEVGAPMVLAGLTALVIGGVLNGTAISRQPPKAAPVKASPTYPYDY